MKTNAFILAAVVLSSCSDVVKNESNPVVIEEGTATDTNQSAVEPTTEITEEVVETPVVYESTTTPTMESDPQFDELLGYWVGDFEPADYTDKDGNSIEIYADEGFYWNRSNKINISIDAIKDSIVMGHSVVAGNHRPFEGVMHQYGSRYVFEVKEPGDHKYDGAFSFEINGPEMKGTWTAYNEIEISKRQYELEKREFAYNADINLDYAKPYVNWRKKIETKEDVDLGDGEFEEWVTSEFATATHKIYEINASNQELTEADVENLKRGDLTIIRNAIYARHGYSFKKRPLRVFFDSQDWYIPVHADIRAAFTDLEKKNIELLLRYEKNAAEYYDSFGRG